MRIKNNSGEACEFTELLHESRSRIFGYIYSLVHNQADAEELFQETAVRLWQKFPDYDPERDFGRWATRFAHLTVLNFIRVNSRRRTFFNAGVLERMAEVHQREATSNSAARSEALAGCLDHLPDRDQCLVESCYSGDRTMKEVAADVGRSAGSIYQSMRRIRRTLLVCVERVMARESIDG